MKPIRFTDMSRYPRGYTHAKATDISKTFARERKRLAEVAARNSAEVAALKVSEEAAEQEARVKVRVMKKGAA